MGKNRAYKGQPMLKVSHFAALYARLPKEEKGAVIAEIDRLTAENPTYCDAGNYDHLSNIFSAAALYGALRRSGKSKEEALRLVSETLWTALRFSVCQGGII